MTATHAACADITPLPQVLCPTGELDMATAPQVFASTNIVRRAGQVSIDLGHITFIDAAGCNAIVGLRNELIAAGGSLRLIGLTPRHTHLLAISGLAALL